MWDWFRKLLVSVGLARNGAAAIARAEVSCTADAVRLQAPGGIRQELRWGDLGGVVIHTNDSGPFDVDLFWILTSRDGRQSLSVPLGAPGEQDLLREMQGRLPGFDNDAVVRAMGSTDNARFDVWSWTASAG